jgi:hypothetical protein
MTTAGFPRWPAKGWFLFFLTRSIVQRRGRFLLAGAAVMLMGTAVTALLTVSAGMRERIGMQLQHYGANMIVTDDRGTPISDARARAVEQLAGKARSFSREVYGTVQVGSATVEVIGRDLTKMAGYRMQGSIPRSATEVLAGRRLQEQFGWKIGEPVAVTGHGGPFTITGFFERGTDEDSALLLQPGPARDLLGIASARSC